jgi:rubrerythrin
MEQNMKLGMNKTGIDMSPILSKEMMAGSEKVALDGGDIEADMMLIEQFYLDNDGPLGSVPMPGTVKGAVKSTMKMVTGHHPEVFINKLGERLAFERSGVRIYEQLIMKCEHAQANGLPGLRIPLTTLQEFHYQEAEHFQMLVECMNKLGADPTAQTPDADASGIAAMGQMKVIMDPRTSISQALEAMLSLELTDNAAWELLIKLAHDMNLPDMVEKFEHALVQEENHLVQVKQWYEESVRQQDMMRLS